MTEMSLPVGKGMWCWKIKYCGDIDAPKYANGTAEQVIDLCKKYGITYVIAKHLDGAGEYNLRPIYGKYGKILGYVDDILQPWVETVSAAGIDVWAYQYVYLRYPEEEAIKAIERTTKLGFSGLFLDVEWEARKKYQKNFGLFGKHFLKRTFPVGLCSYRFPITKQNDMKWHDWLNICDFIAPQVYWELSHNAGQQLEWSLQEYREGRMYNGKFVKGLESDLPYLPVGSAYRRGNNWTSSTTEIIEFMDTAKRLGLPSVSFWEWSNIQKYIPENFAAIGNYDYGWQKG
jgi:hypothetical protein